MVCSIKLLVSTAIGFTQILIMNEMFIVSYLYICVWKTIGRINEDFVHVVLMIINLFFGIYLAIFLMIGQHHISFDKFKFCNGNNMNANSSNNVLGSGLPFMWIALIVSACLCTILFTRTWIVVRRSNIQLVVSNPTIHQIQGSLSYSYDILKMTEYRLFVVAGVLLPNVIVAIIGKAGLTDRNSIATQISRLFSAFSISIMRSFISPIFLIIYRHSFRVKFIKIFKKSSIQPMYDLT